MTRILWLRGREAQNANAHERYIYIHGTPEERNIGRPASYGCIRMRSTDMIQLYEVVGEGARVSIVNRHYGGRSGAFAPATQVPAAGRGTTPPLVRQFVAALASPNHVAALDTSGST